MHGTKPSSQIEEFDLADALSGHWLKLPHAVMFECGAAAQTFAGFLRVTDKETFVATEKIAEKARVPLSTCRKHLIALQEADFVFNAGRGHTRSGAPRRTNTMRLTSKAKESLTPYGMLPWWFTSNVRSHRVTWADKALLSLVMSELAGMRKASEADDAESLWAWLDNYENNHFQMPFTKLHRATGLHKAAIIDAKRMLAKTGLVTWYGETRQDGGNCPHRLVPRPEFRVRVSTALTAGRCYIDFIRGGK